MNTKNILKHFVLALTVVGAISYGFVSAEEATTPDATTPAAETPKPKKHKTTHKKKAAKPVETQNSTVKVPTETAAPVKISQSDSFQQWLKEVKQRISRTKTRNNQVVAVAAVRGSESPDSPPLYWKGMNSSGPVEANELKQFDEAIDSAMTSEPAAAKEKLQAFLSAHPQSPLAGDARETLKQLETPAK